MEEFDILREGSLSKTRRVQSLSPDAILNCNFLINGLTTLIRNWVRTIFAPRLRWSVRRIKLEQFTPCTILVVLITLSGNIFLLLESVMYILNN